jgi:hypothetical protein
VAPASAVAGAGNQGEGLILDKVNHVTAVAVPGSAEIYAANAPLWLAVNQGNNEAFLVGDGAAFSIIPQGAGKESPLNPIRSRSAMAAGNVPGREEAIFGKFFDPVFVHV